MRVPGYVDGEVPIRFESLLYPSPSDCSESNEVNSLIFDYGGLVNLTATSITAGVPTVGGSGTTVQYKETLESCTTADTQSGHIPSTDKGHANISGGGASSYVRTVASGGYARHVDDSGIYSFHKWWETGDLPSLTDTSIFKFKFISGSGFFSGSTHDYRMEITDPATYYGLLSNIDIAWEGGISYLGIKVYGYPLYYKTGTLTNSTEYEIKFVIDWDNNTFDVYINDTLYSEYTDIPFETSSLVRSDLEASRFRGYYLTTTSTNVYINILEWGWEAPGSTPALGVIHVLSSTPITTGIPSIDNPTLAIAGVHNLTANNITAGIPTVDQYQRRFNWDFGSSGTRLRYEDWGSGGTRSGEFDYTTYLPILNIDNIHYLIANPITTAPPTAGKEYSFRETFHLITADTNFTTTVTGADQSGWSLDNEGGGGHLVRPSTGNTNPQWHGPGHIYAANTILSNSTYPVIEFITPIPSDLGAYDTQSIILYNTSGPEYLAQVNWWRESGVNYLDLGALGHSWTGEFSAGSTLKIKFVVDYANHLFDFYINDSLKLAGHAWASAGSATSINRASIYSEFHVMSLLEWGELAIYNPGPTAGIASTVHDLTSVSLATAPPTVSAPTIGQVHILTSTEISTPPPTVSTATLYQVNTLTATDITTAPPTISTPSLGTIHVLGSISVFAGIPTVSVPSIGQVHILTATSIITGAPDVSRPTVDGGIHNLTSTSITTGVPTVSTATVGTKHVLTAVDIITAQPTVSVPSIGQVHIFTSTSITTGPPFVSVPVIGQVHILSSTSIFSGVPDISRPTVSEAAHNLVSVSISTAPPTVSTATLGTRHVLTSVPVTAGDPTVSWPNIGQLHVLTSTQVMAGIPTISRPTAQDIFTYSLTAVSITAGEPTVSRPTVYSFIGTTELVRLDSDIDKVILMESEIEVVEGNSKLKKVVYLESRLGMRVDLTSRAVIQ